MRLRLRPGRRQIDGFTVVLAYPQVVRMAGGWAENAGREDKGGGCSALRAWASAEAHAFL